MTDSTKGTVEFEVENETRLRGFQISQAEPERWKFFEDIIELTDLAKHPKGITQQNVNNADQELFYSVKILDKFEDGESIAGVLDEKYGLFEL